MNTIISAMYKYIVTCRNSRGEIVHYEQLAQDEMDAKNKIMTRYDVRIIDVYMISAK